MKNFKIIVILFSIFIGSCGQTSNNSSEKQANSDQNQNEKTEIDNSYKILSETKNVNQKFGTNKCNIDIELKEKVSKEKLTLIANKLRETRASFDNLWICYYLPGMKVGSGAWATSHFTPNLQVEIIGATAEEETKLKETAENVDGKIFGMFYEQQYTSATFVVYEKNNKMFIKTSFKDGSSSDDEMKKKKVSNGVRLEQKDGGNNGEYFILTNMDVLEFYNAENKKFTTASKTK